MRKLSEPLVQRTTTDIVFDALYEQISTLELLPGSKISEADVANQLGVSRQPVRDAFNRLGNLDLLLIRPQRATEVRGFSMKHIDAARFVRLAVELEVIARACTVWNAEHAVALDENLRQQQEAIESGQTETFHTLDYRFHQLICELSGFPLAFDSILQSKRKVSRLCVLSLGKAEEVSAVLSDHHEIATALKNGSIEDAKSVTRKHLSRLDDTIKEIHEAHSEYFEQI